MTIVMIAIVVGFVAYFGYVLTFACITCDVIGPTPTPSN